MRASGSVEVTRAINSEASGLPGTMVRRPDLPYAQGFFAENERNAILLPDPAVASDAILIEDGPDIAAELNLVARKSVVDGPSRQSADQKQGKGCDLELAATQWRKLRHEYGSEIILDFSTLRLA